MTEAAFKKKKNTKAASDSRVTTHPAYTEYSWETLVGARGTASSGMDGAEAVSGAGVKGDARRMDTAATAGYVKGTARTGRKTNTSARTGAAARNNTEVRKAASAGVKEQLKKAEKVRKKSIVAIHTIAVEKKYSMPISVVLIALCFTVLIMAIVTTSVQISEITAENSALERQYNSMVSEENELRLLLETRDDLRVVERMAKEDLGMVKKDQVDRYYLTVHKEDKIEIIEEHEESGESFFDGVMSFGGAFVERIRGFFGM